MPNRFKDFWHGSERQWHKNLPQGECPPCGRYLPDVGPPRLRAFFLLRRRRSPERRPYFAGWPRMPIEFLHGRPLSPEELEMLRRQIEEGFDNTSDVDDEIRTIVARNWPYLLEKLPPEGE